VDLTGRPAQKSSRLELAAAAVAAGDGTAPMPVTQGWKDIVRHITMSNKCSRNQRPDCRLAAAVADVRAVKTDSITPEF
jgi:hypothetical protein